MPELITGKKTQKQLDAMREGGAILAKIFADIKDCVQPGISEKEVEEFTAY